MPSTFLFVLHKGIVTVIVVRSNLMCVKCYLGALVVVNRAWCVRKVYCIINDIK